MKWKQVLAFLLAGCLLAGTLWSPALASGQKQVALPVDGPQFVIAGKGWATGETMDPAIDYEATGLQLLLQIYDTLVLPPRNAGGDYIPNLAAGWTISADGRTYTFYIRSGVHFSNGALLTPEDVAYTFRRGLLNGGTITPQWLLFEPLLGSTANNDITDLVDSSGSLVDNRAALLSADPARRLAACQKVFQAVAYDEAAGTVTFHLAQAWGPFLETLTGSWGSILDKGWVVNLGGWDGQCSTWASHYNTPPSGSPLANVTNGTGPYNFTSVDGNGNVRLDAKPAYWRTEPAWPGGPVGAPYYKTVLLQNIGDATERKDMLLNGQAQMATIDVADRAEVDGQVMFDYPETGANETLLDPTGVLKRYTRLSPSATDIFFNYKIVKNTKYNVKNHNQFGDAIPLDFFDDIHVRKAFSYAFDWDTWIADTLDGQGVQRRGVIPKGYVGYSDSQPVFSLDLDQAAAEFEQAWGGKVASQGFTITAAYNTGNTARQRALEILKENIESISTSYHVEILEIPWQDYLADYRNRLIPLWVMGWQPDINHPHNFAYSYLTRGGPYGGRQSLPGTMASTLEAKVHECVVLPISQAQACYEELQNLSYLNVVDIWGFQPLAVQYIRAELQGYSPRETGEVLYYYLYETPLPSFGPVSASEPAVVHFDNPGGGMGEAVIPAGAFDVDADIVITPGKAVGDMTSGFRFGDLSFDIAAYGPDGGKLEPFFDPASPVQMVINYDETTLGGINEETLRLLYWDGETWVEAGCGPQVVNADANTLTVPLCHFSDYALAGYPLRYLPLLLGEGPRIDR